MGEMMRLTPRSAAETLYPSQFGEPLQTNLSKKILYSLDLYGVYIGLPLSDETRCDVEVPLDAMADAIECFVTHPEPDMQLREVAFRVVGPWYPALPGPFVNHLKRIPVPFSAPFPESC